MRKKKKNPVLKVLGLLFVVFMALYIANMSGYYESKIRDRVIITEEGIKNFEQAIKNGDEIDITSFLNTEREDYSSSMSNFGENVTSSIENVVVGSMDIVSDIIKSLF